MAGRHDENDFVIFKWLCRNENAGCRFQVAGRHNENSDAPFSIGGGAGMKIADAIFKWLVSGIKRLIPISGGEGPA
jgi:hypothetical protein